MKAIVVSAFGGPEQLRLTEAAEPVAGADQVRIVVHACGVNPVDAGNRADGTWAGLRAPCILGYDVAGVVDQVGSDVSTLAVGDRVMAMTRFPDGAGGYAELVVVDADQVARLDTDGLVRRSGRNTACRRYGLGRNGATQSPAGCPHPRAGRERRRWNVLSSTSQPPRARPDRRRPTGDARDHACSGRRPLRGLHP